MGGRFHAASGIAAPFEMDGAGAFVRGLIESPAGCVLIHGHGGIGGILLPAYCGPSWTMAVEAFWWAERDGMPLLRAFEEWGRSMGAKEVRMTTLAALPRADAILRRKGYAPVEISYTKVI